MLVLTRRLKEKLLFPGFNTSVQILDFKGGKVRLGIEAPNTVSVLREELQDGPMSMPPDEEALNEKIRQANHLLRNRLNVAGIGLALLTKQIQSGLLQEGQVTIEKIKEDFEMLRAEGTGRGGEKEHPPSGQGRQASEGPSRRGRSE